MNADKVILIVDDTNVNILKADFILKNEGYTTLKATSGMSCLKVLKTNHVDLVLLDIEMPDMNGFETLDEIRKNPATKDIPVIFVTSDHDTDIVLKAIQKKVAAYVTKPFNEEELLTHVTKVFSALKEEAVAKKAAAKEAKEADEDDVGDE